MTRKDIIIIAVLANIGVLAIIFMLASRSQEDKVLEQPEISYTIETPSEPEPLVNSNTIALESMDEGDILLQDISQDTLAAPFTQDDEDILGTEDRTHVHDNGGERSSNQSYVEVTIKRGDALEKIARANGTTVEAIKKANQLQTDRLKIGQVLQVPVGAAKKPVEVAMSAPSSTEAQYYVIKSGDNPWKIAKQYQIRVDELLKLNNLNQESARNLKIGDKIRVK